MPLIRAFGRWLRGRTIDEEPIVREPSRPLFEGTGPDAGTRSAVIILGAAIGTIPILLTGGGYELVHAIDRRNMLGERGHWVAAVVIAVLIGWLAFSLLTRSA